jgi:GNAT superfamily N-acetyltransferase
VTEHNRGIRIEPINKSHRRGTFDCGNESINRYLKKYARQNDEKNIAKTFVAVDNDNIVIGFYCLSAASIEFPKLPPGPNKHLPRYPVPVARIGQLGVDTSFQGTGLGARLLINALYRIASVSKELAVRVVIVDVINNKAVRFYQHFGFISLPNHKTTLFLPIETITELFT